MKSKSLDGPWLGGETVAVLLMVLAIFVFVATVDADARKGVRQDAHHGRATERAGHTAH